MIGTGIPLATSGELHLAREAGARRRLPGLVAWHIRRPQAHALEGAIFVGSLAIVWLGASLAH